MEEEVREQAQTSLQVRVGTKHGLSWQTYNALRHAAIDERKTLGDLIEEVWALRQQAKDRPDGSSVI